MNYKKYIYRLFYLAVLVITLIGSYSLSSKYISKLNSTIHDTLKVGILFSQTGSISSFGKKALDGYQLAAEELARDGIHIEWVIEDAKSSPKDAATAAQKLIATDKVSVIIGPESSGLALAVAPIANKYKVVLLAPTVASDKYSTPDDYTFRNWPASKLIAEKAADIAIKLKYKSIAILTIDNEMGVSYASYFKTRFESLGGKVELVDSYKSDETNFSTPILKLKNIKIEALYLIGQIEMGQVIKQLKEQGINLPVISGVGIEDPKVAEIAGSSINGIIYTTPSFNPSTTNGVANDYEKEFEHKFNKPSEIFAASTYDATILVGKVISENATNSEEIKNKLENTKNYAGVTGSISFDKNGDVIKDIAIKKIVDLKYVFLNESLEVIR